jgi:hypothetical protein
MNYALFAIAMAAIGVGLGPMLEGAGVHNPLAVQPAVAAAPVSAAQQAWDARMQQWVEVLNETNTTFRCGALCKIFNEVNGPVIFDYPGLHHAGDKIAI